MQAVYLEGYERVGYLVVERYCVVILWGGVSTTIAKVWARMCWLQHVFQLCERD